MDFETLENELTVLLNEEKFEKAREKIRLLIPTTNDKYELAFLYNWLINLGSENSNKKDLLDGLKYLEENETDLLKIISKSNHFYNLANAKSALLKIHKIEGLKRYSLDIIRTTVQPAIDAYWIALKNIETEDDQKLLPQILINLSNSFKDSVRLIDAMQILDTVIKIYPQYFQAFHSRGTLLNLIGKITCYGRTASMLYEIRFCLETSIQSRDTEIPQSIKQETKNLILEVNQTAKELGTELKNYENEKIISLKEFNGHSDFRKFCIENYLTLNEHGIYCNCVGVKFDDLHIGVPNTIFSGKIVGRLELLLNRIKSEFGMARWLYYQTEIGTNPDFQIKYSDLFDHEIIESRAEFLRTSFRICYGILDKIALGICKLFKLTKEGQTVHFESFWKSNPSHWEILNESRNIHLHALYSLACDLNTKSGELKDYKRWRNLLEHKVLIFRNLESNPSDDLNLLGDRDFIDDIDINDFNGRTLHLLQLTRASIFSFVYCVRLETIQHPDKNKGNHNIEIGYK